MYKKLKKQNGENFAQTLRNFHSGLLDIPDLDLIVRHAGRQAEPLIPYLMGLMSSNDDTPAASPENPFTLLDRAGYESFHADTLQKQNSIKRYFAPGELLCTFNDHARYRDYYIVHAVKKDVNDIKRAAFKGREAREDEYGRSVISIQMLKKGGFISIKNRYNDFVDGADNTFNSNPDNIIEGLSAALKDHFSVDFSATETNLPEGFVLKGNRIIKYHLEENNIYYGDQVWTQDATIHAVNRAAGDALFYGFLFDNKTKTLQKIDPEFDDSFAEDFNRCYGGNRALCVQNGNLTLNGDILIGTEGSQIKTLSLPALTTMSNQCLYKARALTQFHAPALTTMGNRCLRDAYALTRFHAPALTTMGYECFYNANTLTQFDAPALTAMDGQCLHDAYDLTQFHAPALTTMGNRCLYYTYALTQFHAPALTTMGHECLHDAYALTQFHAPALTTMGSKCLHDTYALTQFGAPALTSMGHFCLRNAPVLTQFDAPALTAMGNHCLRDAPALTQFHAPALTTIGNNFLDSADALTQFHAPALTTMGNQCLSHAHALTQFHAPGLTTMGNLCLYNAHALTRFDAPALTTMSNQCLYKARALTQFHAPALTTMGDFCLYFADALTRFDAPALTTMGDKCLYKSSPEIRRNIRLKPRHASITL